MKFRQAGGSAESFEADERGLRLIAAVGPPSSGRAPSLVAVNTTGARPVTTETAAVGAPLVYALRAPGRRADKQASIDSVARWVIELGRATAEPGGGAEALDRLQFPEGIVAQVGADPPRLVEQLNGIPSVLEHRELAPAHVLVSGGDFTVIDWEDAGRGLPLADLAFFLAQVLPILDGELDDPTVGRHEAFARLFRGETPSSATLFGHLGDACRALAISDDAIGPLLSLTWLRLAAWPRSHFAEVWFSDPRLGPAWKTP
jgi:hypothetical protein